MWKTQTDARIEQFVLQKQVLKDNIACDNLWTYVKNTNRSLYKIICLTETGSKFKINCDNLWTVWKTQTDLRVKQFVLQKQVLKIILTAMTYERVWQTQTEVRIKQFVLQKQVLKDNIDCCNLLTCAKYNHTIV